MADLSADIIHLVNLFKPQGAHLGPFDAKPLPEMMLTYQMRSFGEINKSWIKMQTFWENVFENVVCKMVAICLSLGVLNRIITILFMIFKLYCMWPRKLENQSTISSAGRPKASVYVIVWQMGWEEIPENDSVDSDWQMLGKDIYSIKFIRTKI